MKELHLDIETYSATDLTTCGVYKYVEDPEFSILLIAYAFGDEETKILSLPKTFKDLPEDLQAALLDKNTLKIAHNAAFERICLNKFFNIKIPVPQFFCTAVAASYLGLPRALEQVAQVLNLSEQKDRAGKDLIRYFCKPCKPTKTNGGRTRNTPQTDMGRWVKFKNYCVQDVETERAIYNYVKSFKKGIPENEWLNYQISEYINDYGVYVDTQFINKAINLHDNLVNDALFELKQLTGLINPNSLQQLKKWIYNETGEQVALNAETIPDILNSSVFPEHVKKAVRLRSIASNTSTSKLGTILDYKTADERIHGQFAFYGANRTGRFAGQGVQLHNLKRTPKGDLAEIRAKILKAKTLDGVFENPSKTVSQMIRTALVAAPCHKLIAFDYTSIEAFILAWLAGEEWVLNVARSHGKLYEATAAQMFKIDINTIAKDSPERAKGKIATLALGYQGAVGALTAMSAIDMGLTEDELPAIVRAWRKANTNIVRLWRDVEASVKRCIKTENTVTLRKKYCRLLFSYSRGYLSILLPSGRHLYYYDARVDESTGKLTYFGVNQTRKTWEQIDTYGGSLVENITQAVARDCLTELLQNLYFCGFNVVMHVHDEAVVEVADDEVQSAFSNIQDLINTVPEWAKGLPLSGSGYVSDFYKKD